MKELLTTIRIFHITVCVYVADQNEIKKDAHDLNENEMALGIYVPIRNEILLSDELDGHALHSTASHEVVHAIIDVYGYHFNIVNNGELEESVCDFVSAQMDDIVHCTSVITSAYQKYLDEL